jgi:hypothetical protein
VATSYRLSGADTSPSQALLESTTLRATRDRVIGPDRVAGDPSQGAIEESPDERSASDRRSRDDDDEDDPDRIHRDRPRLTAEDIEPTRLWHGSHQAGLREDRLSSIASTDPNVRASAAKRLETERPDEFTPLSEALLHGPSARVRMNAAEQMGFGDPNQTLHVLETALSDSDPDFSAYPHFALYWIIGF